MIPRHFGTRHLGAIRGIVHFGTVATSAFGPIVLALGYEASGSHTPAVPAPAAVPAAIAIAALIVPVPDREIT